MTRGGGDSTGFGGEFCESVVEWKRAVFSGGGSGVSPITPEAAHGTRRSGHKTDPSELRRSRLEVRLRPHSGGSKGTPAR